VNENLQIEKWVAVEALRALTVITKNPNSYYSKIMPDDAANIREAIMRLEKAIEASQSNKN
jgi:hypothetical protein